MNTQNTGLGFINTQSKVKSKKTTQLAMARGIK